MTVSELDKAIKPTMRGAYLFYGEEEYLKLRYREKLRATLLTDEGMAPFNHARITELAKLPAEIETLPMMADCRLIEVEDIVFSKLNKDTLEALAALFTRCEDCVVLFYTRSEEFSAGTPKKPSEAMKKLAESCQIVEFPKQTPARLANWAGKHFTANGTFASAELCHVLIERCGTDMNVLANEIAKLSAYALAKGETHITREMIETVVTPYLESGAFDFVNAIMEGNTQRAFLLFSERRAKREKPIEILSAISRVVTELVQVKVYTEAGLSPKDIAALMKKNEYAVKLQQNALRGRSLASLQQAATLCYETDIKLKSRSIDKYILLERLILELGRSQ
ncbi:MAG: DNA polymerase III subunit delta [Clostridia bacterium]|nr:DNA polymerase III subunit delta [Clostridia bacterium]